MAVMRWRRPALAAVAESLAAASTVTPPAASTSTVAPSPSTALAVAVVVAIVTATATRALVPVAVTAAVTRGRAAFRPHDRLIALVALVLLVLVGDVGEGHTQPLLRIVGERHNGPAAVVVARLAEEQLAIVPLVARVEWLLHQPRDTHASRLERLNLAAEVFKARDDQNRRDGACERGGER